MNKSGRIATLLALALLSACQDSSSSGGDDDTDTDTDTGSDSDVDTDVDSDTDSDTDVDSDGDWCGSGLGGDCPEDWGELEPVVDADDLTGEVRFVALSDNGSAILAERTDGDIATPLIVVLDPGWWEYGIAELESPPVETLFAVAVTQVGGDLPWHVALLCTETTCALWGTDVEDGETGVLEPIEGGEVPSSMSAARGLATLEFGGSRPCVFGDGIACFDGATWEFEVDSGDGPLLNDLEFGYDVEPLAVGDEGYVLRKTVTGWDTVEAGTNEALVAVSSRWDGVALLGFDGALIVGGSDPASWQLCEAGGAPMLGLNWVVAGTTIVYYIELLTADGAVLRIDEAGDTCTVAGEIEGEAVAIADGGLGTCWETRVLTEQALYSKVLGCTE